MAARALARVPDVDETPSDAGRLRLAVAAFLRREDGRDKPSGEWRASVWYPDPAERRTCCDSIEVSPKNRQALYDHCCTRAHIAALYDVGPNDLRQAIREERPTPATMARQLSTRSATRGTAVEALFESSRRAQEMSERELTQEVARFLPFAQEVASGQFEAKGQARIDGLHELRRKLEGLQLAIEFALTIEETHLTAAQAYEAYAMLQQGKNPAS